VDDFRFVLCGRRGLRNAQFRNGVGKIHMHVLALISRKGGTGKSTLAIGLAGAALEAGHNVCVVEADPLGTVSNWRRRRDRATPAVERVHDGHSLQRCLRKLAADGVAIVIIDTAGGWSETFNAAVGAADLCLIPVRPSQPDIEAAGPAVATVRAAAKPFAFVLNQTPVRSCRVANATCALGEAATAFGLNDVIALPAIVARNDQQDALRVGLTVTEFAGDGKSAAEIRGLWQWVKARLDSLQGVEVQTAETAALRSRTASGANIVTVSATGINLPTLRPAREMLAGR
jgi:chromosome partitioning protein